MTLKRKKNHYNVKLLRRYGYGVRMKGNRVVLKDGIDPFTGNQETEEWFVAQIPYERIVIAGKGYVSTEAINVLAGYSINAVLTALATWFATSRVMSSDMATRYMMGQ